MPCATRTPAAAVILEVETGRILAMYSHPGFDLNLMSGRLTREQQARLAGDPHRPFRDKTVADTYNPGSTFKVVTAVTALDEGVVDQDDRTVCRGSIELGQAAVPLHPRPRTGRRRDGDDPELQHLLLRAGRQGRA